MRISHHTTPVRPDVITDKCTVNETCPICPHNDNCSEFDVKTKADVITRNHAKFDKKTLKPKADSCTLYHRECMDSVCSVTPTPEDCQYRQKGIASKGKKTKSDISSEKAFEITKDVKTSCADILREVNSGLSHDSLEQPSDLEVVDDFASGDTNLAPDGHPIQHTCSFKVGYVPKDVI